LTPTLIFHSLGYFVAFLVPVAWRSQSTAWVCGVGWHGSVVAKASPETMVRGNIGGYTGESSDTTNRHTLDTGHGDRALSMCGAGNIIVHPISEYRG
jgi:hypothetical protein